MKRNNHSAIILLALLLVFSFAGTVLAETIGRFTAVEGRVDVLRPGQTRAEPVRKDDTVAQGDIVRTKSNSFAEIVFSDGAVLKISEGSRMEIKDYELTDNNKRKNGTLRLLRGKIRATVPKTLGRLIPISTGPSTFEVQTPTAVAGVRGTDFFVWFDRGTTGVFVLDGTVETRNARYPQDILMVNAGYFTIIRQDEAARNISAIRDRALIIKEGESLSRRADMETARRHGEHGGDFDHLREQELISGASSELKDGGEYHTEHSGSLERPVTETNTALLSTEGDFSGKMSGSSVSSPNTLTITSTSLTGEWKDTGVWESIIRGTFTTTCQSCTFAWSGTTSGTDVQGGTFSGTVTNGTWNNGTWTADISGTKTGGTFAGTMSGTYSSSSFTGTGTGTWK